MEEHYTLLAPVYDTIGMADYAREVVPLMLDYAQRTDWLGRQIMELGCGTGEGINTLAESGFKLVGIDNAPEMLNVAKTKMGDVQWVQADIKMLPTDQFVQQDLIIAVDLVNELDSLREYQSMFQSVYDLLQDERLFMFDMYTIAGLTKRGTQGDQLMFDDDGVTAFIMNKYDYERQMAKRTYVVFWRDERGYWNRLDADRSMRVFPISAVGAMLQRVGFSDVKVLDHTLRALDPRRAPDRVVFVATK